jgi:hypothetical protein
MSGVHCVRIRVKVPTQLLAYFGAILDLSRLWSITFDAHLATSTLNMPLSKDVGNYNTPSARLKHRMSFMMQIDPQSGSKLGKRLCGQMS